MLNIILLIGMYPAIFIIYFTMKYSGKNRNGTMFGLCVPRDEQLAEEFYRQVENKQVWYQHRMRSTFFIFLVLPLISIAVPYLSIQFTIWMLWLLLAIVFFELPCIMVNRELKEWKKSVQIQEKAKQDNINLVELSKAGQVRKTKLSQFLLPILLSAAAVAAYYFFRKDVYGRRMTWVIAVIAACTPMFYAAAKWMDRQRTAVVSYDSEVNVNYARAKKRIWNQLWLLCAWINTAFTWGVGMALKKDKFLTGMLWGTIPYIIVITACILLAVRKVNRLERRYEKKIDPMLREEDDDCWIGGVLYYNKSDKHIMVETRVGYGTTINAATLAGKVFLAIGAAAILSVPIACLWMILLEFTPIKLNIQEDYLIAKQLRNDYKIAVDEISDLELVDDLPKLSKNAGTGMDNLYKGNWHILYNGDCEVFLNPKNEVFLKFTSEGVLYYMSASDDMQTRAVYEELQKRQ